MIVFEPKSFTSLVAHKKEIRILRQLQNGAGINLKGDFVAKEYNLSQVVAEETSTSPSLIRSNRCWHVEWALSELSAAIQGKTPECINNLRCKQKSFLEIELQVPSQRGDILSKGRITLMLWVKKIHQRDIVALECYHNV